MEREAIVKFISKKFYFDGKKYFFYFTRNLTSLMFGIAHQATLENIMLFPKTGSRKSVKGNKRQRTLILTDTPVQNELNRLQEMKKKSVKNSV